MMNRLEIEIKFYVRDLRKIEECILQDGGTLIMPRTYEVNLRFDTPDGSLSASGQALRLRKDQAFTLTYKGASREEDGVKVRTEIQTRVEDFDAAKALLEALGYKVYMTYQKYRREYLYRDTHVSLDEMPYGTFMEVEGENPVVVRAVCDKLGLQWDKRISLSYIEIFQKIQQQWGLNKGECTFEEFKAWKGSLALLGIIPADSG